MESKQRLRPWLEAQINNGEIPGLCWLNLEKTKFRIPWKHGGKQDWNPDSGRIFKEWARHTGRFREGIDEPDYVKWKTRLRCAFNKAPDIEEVKEESQLEGPDPFRVYILKPRKNGKKVSEPENKAYVHSSPHRFQCQQGAAPIPTFLENITMSTESFPSDLKDIKTEDFVKIEGTQMSISNISMDDIVMLSDNFQSLKLGQQRSNTASSGNSMILKIFYSGNEVMDKTVESEHGCRLYYNTFTVVPVPGLPDWMAPLVCEAHRGDNLCLPPCQDLMNTPKQQHFWQAVLDRGLTEGICLATHDDDIYALRFCSCQLFYVSECGTEGKPVPLMRRMKDGQIDGAIALTKIFDYRNAFLPALENYRAGIGPKPSPSVYLLFGFSKAVHDLQDWQGGHIYATVTSAKALAALGEFSEGQMISSDEKCASAILDMEALLKADPNNPAFATPDFNPGADDDFLDHLFQLGFQQGLAVPDVTASADAEGLSFDESTLDFNDLCYLGIGDRLLEFK